MTPTYIIYARRYGLVVTDHSEFGKETWFISKKESKEPHKCVICGSDVSGTGYRTLTFGKPEDEKWMCEGHGLQED